VFIVFALLAGIGLPGSASFIAELHVLIGGFGRWGGWLALLSVGVLISAAYALRAVRRLSTGPECHTASPGMERFADLDRSEVAAAGLLAAGILLIGCYPAPLLGLIGASVAQLARHFGG
jgi:NADH-quinone oxidoreductase subunit M